MNFFVNEQKKWYLITITNFRKTQRSQIRITDEIFKNLFLVNGVAWAPHSSCHVCTAGDDKQALIWDIQQMPRAIGES